MLRPVFQRAEGTSPLCALLTEINAASVSGMPLLAIGMAVALPDICVSLSSADGRSDAKRYKEWCGNNLNGPEFSYLTPEDLYSIRCGVLHNGRFGDLKHSVERVIFALPTSAGNSIVNSVSQNAYFYGVADFCNNMTKAVYKWMEANKETENVRANIGRLMQYREGFPPYIGGNLKLLA